MRALLLPISDIHVRQGRENPILERVPRIVEAVRNLEPELDLCVVLFTGDVGFAGTEEEYALALGLVGELRSGLASGLPDGIRVAVAALAGNHDCDFARDTGTRRTLLRALASAEPPELDASIISACTAVQQDFAAFRYVVEEEEPPTGDNLAYSYTYEVDGERLIIQCYNTAWLSQNPEQQGQLYFPVERVAETRPEASVVVAAFHHPYGWMPADNARAFRKRVEAVADLILTGHEHDPTHRRQTTDAGGQVYLESGALQDSGDPEKSDFHAVVIDTTSRLHRVVSFAWDGSRYTRAEERDWASWPGVEQRTRGVFEPDAATLAWEEDLGLHIRHPAAPGVPTLSQIFVAPDLLRDPAPRAPGSGRGDAARPGLGGGKAAAGRAVRNLMRPQASAVSYVRGEALAEFLLRKKHVVVTGPERCGKTTLAKATFRRLREMGLVPLYLDGKMARVRPQRVVQDLETELRRQYGEEALEAYRQLPREQRPVILDHVHRLIWRGEPLQALVTALTQLGGPVLLLANDLAYSVVEAFGGESLAAGEEAFEVLYIQPYGHALRDELATRWFDLDPAVSADAALKSRKLAAVKTTIDNTIGRDFIPAYPAFLLPILQAISFSQPLNLAAGAHSYHVELMIRDQLSTGPTMAREDIKVGYLTHLAYAMFQRNTPTLTDTELREVHLTYEQQKKIKLNYTDLLAELERRDVLRRDAEDHYEFRYPYIFFFFLAKHLADNIWAAETQKKVEWLIQHMDEEGPANTVLFLAHLSKHPMIAQGLREKADSIFVHRTPATLRNDTTPFAWAAKTLHELAFQDRPVEERRKEHMLRLDEQEAVSAETAVAAMEARDDLALIQEMLQEYTVAVRTLQTLGQTAKNSPGHMDGDEKVAVVRSAYALGLRTLTDFFEMLRENADDLVDAIRESLEEPGKTTAASEVQDEAQKRLRLITVLGAYGIIRRIALAVGDPDLAAVYDDLVEAEDTPPSVRLVDQALRLEQFSERFPYRNLARLGEELESERLAYEVLRLLVHTHLHLYEVKREDKQRICAELGIDYTQYERRDRRKLLLKTTAS